MELQHFVQLVRNRKKTIVAIMAIFLVIGAVVIFSQRFKYSSSSQVLVVQEYNRTVDAYTASKSSEYLSSVLANVITSNSFFTKVKEAGFGIDTDYFGTEAKDEMKTWQETVSAKSLNDSGIIAISVYHPDRAQAEKIVRSINYVLMTQHTAYHGSGDSVKIRLIDQPITSKFPVKPNIPLTVVLAIGLGFVTSLVYIYLLSDPQPSFAPHHQMTAHGVHPNQPLPRPSAHRAPPHRQPTQAEIRGQRPEEAVAYFDGGAYQPPVVTPYGTYAQVAVSEEEEEGGYLDDTDLTAEELIRHGNMRNVLD